MSTKAYWAWLFAANTYVLAFMQRMSPQTINSSLMSDFSLDASSIAILTSGYFLGYTAMQIPAGPMVDVYGIRRMAIIGLIVSITGTIIFSFSANSSMAFCARIMIASGDAMAFSILIKLVAQFFSDDRFGLMSGLSQAAGYFGGALATAPLAWLVSEVSWRSSFLMIALVGVFNLVGICITFPPDNPRDSKKNINWKVLYSVLRQHISDIPSWGCALVNCCHFFIITILAGVWGMPMLANTFGVDLIQAGRPMILFMIGNIVGSICIGRLVDKYGNEMKVLFILSVIRGLLILLLFPVIAFKIGFFATTLNLFILGVVSGGFIPIILKYVKYIYTAPFMGTGASLSMTFAGVATAVLLPVLGGGMRYFSMDLDGTYQDKIVVSAQGYNFFVLFLLGMSFLGILANMLMQADKRIRGEN